jgi:phospholipid/cholesterol/gamma-HCH transport system substrate-binding protein
MKGFSAEMKVGIFAIVVIVFLSFMTFKVGGLDWLRAKKGYTVYAYFKDIAGLDEKTKVKVAGVDAGVIKSIALKDGTARVELGINQEVKLYSDACAYIKATGLLGDKYLEITIGSKEPLLKEGETVMCVQEIMSVDDLVRNLTNVSGNLNEFISKMNESLSKKDIDSLKETMRNLRDASGTLKSIMSENDERMKNIIRNLDSAASSMNDVMGTNKESLNEIIANLKDFSESLKGKGPTAVDNLSRASEELRSMVEENRPGIKKFTDKASTAMDSMTNISERLERGEGTLGKLMKDERLYTSLTNTVDSLEKTVTAIERFKTYLTFQGDYLFKSKDSKGAFYLTLQPKKEKYYILGIVSDPIGKVDTKETITDGVKSTEEEIEKDIEFTAQFARRFTDTALRIGITESTFGVGADQFFLDDKLKVSIDAWDFSKDEEGAKNPHVRLGADYFVFKNIFISGGIDNVFNSKWRGAFLGGGVRFEDEDFKYIFGTVPKVPGK